MIQLSDTKHQLDDSIAFFKQDIASLRTGRATPALVEHVHVEAYGAKTPLMHVASITAPDPRTIMIQPWDKALLKDIEKAITQSDLNIAPIVDGAFVRLSLPQLTEENRKNLVKILHQKAEAAKVVIRQQREKTRGEATRSEESGEISEDQKFKLFKDLDELVKGYNDMIASIVQEKEKEIMTL